MECIARDREQPRAQVGIDAQACPGFRQAHEGMLKQIFRNGARARKPNQKAKDAPTITLVRQVETARIALLEQYERVTIGRLRHLSQ
jgi:hypothetical protein